jgi:hypothetical protein
MTSDSEVVTVDLWRKDGQREEIMMIIYELLGRHPRIVTYHGHDPVTFELRVLLQHLPNGDLNGYLQQHPEVPFQNRPKGSLTFIPKMLYGMTSTLATCSSPMTCMLSSATSAPFMSNQIVGFSLKSAHLYHTYAPGLLRYNSDKQTSSRHLRFWRHVICYPLGSLQRISPLY